MAQAAPAAPAENWSDDVFVEHWVQREAGRSALRARHFGMLRALLPFAPDASFRYLNVGAGPGASDELVLSRFPHAHATLLDGSPAMLRHARERLARFGDRVTFAEADLASSAWTAATAGPFNAVTSCIAIHNLRDSARVRLVYREIFDVMAEGGLFVNLDYVRLSSPRLRPLATWAKADADGGFLSSGGGGENLPGTVEEQLVWLREAGFGFVDCFFKDFGVAIVGGFKGQPNVPQPATVR